MQAKAKGSQALETREIKINDEVYEWRNTNLNHESARHGRHFGIDAPINNSDSLPTNTEYSTTRTKTNKVTRQQFTDAIKSHCEKFPAQDGVTIRGTENCRIHLDPASGKMVGSKLATNGRWRIQYTFQLSEIQLDRFFKDKKYYK